MRLTHFDELCHTIWRKYAPEFTDLVGLRLTPESHAELSADVNTTPPGSLHAVAPSGTDADGSVVEHLVNPVTRSNVTVTSTPDAGHDSLLVKVPVFNSQPQPRQ
jgi:hypothetical protein